MRLSKVLIFALLVAIAAPPVLADDDAADIAIDRGLAFLANQQNGDGSFEAPSDPVSTTALSLLAFLSTGNTADGGRYAPTVRRATEFLLRHTPPIQQDRGRLQDQALTMLALAEAYGVEPDEATRLRIRASVKDSVSELISAQNIKKPNDQDGGWNADPNAADSDPLISQTCSNGLEAAQKIGVSVPKPNVDRALAYLAHHQRPSTTQSSTEPPLAAQLKDGSWPSESTLGEPNRVRATSLAILTLAKALQLRPVLQAVEGR